MSFELLDHTSEIGFRATGNTIEEAFASAGKALFEIMTDIDELKCEETVGITVESENLDALLFDFIDKLIYISQADDTLLCDFDLTIEATENGYRIHGVGYGQAIRDGMRLQEVKAPTYSDMVVEQRNKKWFIEMFLDV